MNITITSFTRPNSCDHYLVQGTIDGAAASLIMHKNDLTVEPGEATERTKNRIVSFIKENNLTTPLGIKNAIEGQSFKI